MLPDPQRYFKYQHTAIDTFDKISEREVELGRRVCARLLERRARARRGGDGSLFVLERARKGWYTPKPMLGEAAIEALSPEEAKTYDASKDVLPSGEEES